MTSRPWRIAAALAVVVVVALSSGCAANLGRQPAPSVTCGRLVAAVKTALDAGSAPLDSETAAFARTLGLRDSVVPDPGGPGYRLVPKSLPFPLMAAADPKDGGRQYQAAVASLTPEYRRQLAAEGRRCEW
jgi:hypothetical protein